MQNKSSKFNLRYIAEIAIEAVTPLKVGSGAAHLVQDSPIARDANGFPVIPGTALTGVIRRALDTESATKNNVLDFFGSTKTTCKETESLDDGMGSRITISCARILDEEGEPAERLLTGKERAEKIFLSALDTLPVRDHVRITHRGAADVKNHGKFDEEILYRGTRFVFRIELMGNSSDAELWRKVIDAIESPAFRIGGGTRKGFGKIKVIAKKIRIHDLLDKNGMNSYLAESSKLLSIKDLDFTRAKSRESTTEDSQWLKYQLKLIPETWFLFGSGHGDDKADMTPILERHITWNEQGKGNFKERITIIPASSIKGAISHRVAFHYNRLTSAWAHDPESKSGEDNEAVTALFGRGKNRSQEGIRGKVILDDLALEVAQNDVIIPHIALDRFTMAPREGALFFERVTRGTFLNLELYVNKKAWAGNNKIKEAFENSLEDIACGLLPLGGGVMRGNGVFIGKLEKTESIHV